MARPRTKHPTDMELEILQVLWDSGPCALGDICASLRSNRPVATTTVSTMLKVMNDKNLVHRIDKAGRRGSTWKAGISRTQAARGFVTKMVDRIFDGSTEQLVAHIIKERKLSAADRLTIQRLLEQSGGDK